MTVKDVLETIYSDVDFIELHAFENKKTKNYFSFFYGRNCAIKEFGNYEAFLWQDPSSEDFFEPCICFILPKEKHQKIK